MEKADQPPPYSSQTAPPAGAPPQYGFAPPPQQAPPLQPVQQQQQMVQPIVVAQAVPLGPDSIRMKCPHCQSDVDTSTEQNPSIMAWIAAGVLCFVGCFFGCCLIPLCMDSCKSTEHKCPSCRRFIGKYSQY